MSGELPEPPAGDATLSPPTETVESSEPASTQDSALPPDVPGSPAAAQRPVRPFTAPVDVTELDWAGIERAVELHIAPEMPPLVERMEAFLVEQACAPQMLFDDFRASRSDRVIQVGKLAESPLWIIGDLHGDLLALEAALEHIARSDESSRNASIVFLGDLLDDGGYGAGVLLRVFHLIVDAPQRVCLIAGNHDEALAFNEGRFTSTVEPSDFAAYLNEHAQDEWSVRAGKAAIQLFAQCPRALFLPDGLLIAHGGFPLTDLHQTLAATGNWNDEACVQDFVWTRAHPTARKKLPNRFTRGGQFGHQDLAQFAKVATELGRLVTHMVRGHDHVEERYAIFSAYSEVPILTTVALSRRLAREAYGPYVRVPTIARYQPEALPEIHRLRIPEAMVRRFYPEAPEGGAVEGTQ